MVDAVPDSVRAYGNQLLVTFLTGFPFSNGDSKVLVVDPVTGATAPFISWLNSSIDIVYRSRGNGATAAVLPAGIQYAVFWQGRRAACWCSILPGERCWWMDSTHLPVWRWIRPAGKLYIASRTDGKIMQVSVGQ